MHNEQHSNELINEKIYAISSRLVDGASGDSLLDTDALLHTMISIIVLTQKVSVSEALEIAIEKSKTSHMKLIFEDLSNLKIP